MGQLEKYGLYVLCLVIFLIFGVTLFGGDGPHVKRPSAELNAQGPATGGTGAGTASMRDMFAGAKQGDAAKQGDTRAKGTASDASAKPVDGSLPVAGKIPTGDAGKSDASAKDLAGKDAGRGSGTVSAGAGADSARPSHTVAAGDTYTSIAKTHFGSPGLVGEIARLNPAVNPAKLKPGQVLLLPTKAEADRLLAPKVPAAPAGEVGAASGAGKLAAKPATKPATDGAAAAKTGARVYIVAKNDTLEGIAHSQLGSRQRVDELRALNPDVDPTRMRVGQPIQLPKK